MVEELGPAGGYDLVLLIGGGKIGVARRGHGVVVEERGGVHGEVRHAEGAVGGPECEGAGDALIGSAVVVGEGAVAVGEHLVAVGGGPGHALVDGLVNDGVGGTREFGTGVVEFEVVPRTGGAVVVGVDGVVGVVGIDPGGITTGGEGIDRLGVFGGGVNA